MYNREYSITGGIAHLLSGARNPGTVVHFRMLPAATPGGLVLCSREHGDGSGGGFAPVVGEK
jgi:hypothetical protein